MESTNEIKIFIGDNTDIKYESPENFKNSVHHKAYEEAFKITKNIIRATDKMTRERHQGNRDVNKGTEIRNREQVGNIIFFTGERGTGKTSAMLSYMEYLKDYYRDTKNHIHHLGDFSDAKKYYMFTGIDYIDASSLDKKEDILGIVLSKMLKKWIDEEHRSHGGSGILRAEDYEYKKRTLRIQFNDVYQRLKDLRDEKDITQRDEDTFLETLERLSVTGNLKESFKKLVKSFLDIMCYPGSENDISSDNHFLIISIDDLDMNINNGFMLLEQIRKYLMVPHVIVLLSANYEQLEKICYNHYANEFDKIRSDDRNKNYIKSLSIEYLEKMIPLQRQINLLAGRKQEFFGQKKIIITYDKHSDENFDSIETCEVSGTLQEIVAKKYYEIFKARFAKNEQCVNTLAPDTVRELCSWINQIYKLEHLIENESSVPIYQNNIQWLWNVEFPRICKKNLSYEEQAIFEELERLNVVSQINVIKNLLIKEVPNTPPYSGERWISDASLLELLAWCKQTSVEKQPLSAVSTIYFTMRISEVLFRINAIDNIAKSSADSNGSEKSNELNAEAANLRKQMMQYFSVPDWGIWGSWEQKMTTKIVKEAKLRIEYASISWIKFRKTNDCLKIALSKYEGEDDVPSICSYIKKNKQKLIDYQYILLFYHLDVNDINEIGWKWEKNKGEENNTIDIAINLSNDYSGTFCFSGCILNIFEGAELIRRFVDELPKMIYQGSSPEEMEKVVAACDEISILPELQNLLYTMLMPLDSVEYLLTTGRELMVRLGKQTAQDNWQEQVGQQASRYFTTLLETEAVFDKQHGSTYYEKMQSFPLIERIQNAEFIELLASSVGAAFTDPVRITNFESEW